MQIRELKQISKLKKKLEKQKKKQSGRQVARRFVLFKLNFQRGSMTTEHVSRQMVFSSEHIRTDFTTKFRLDTHTFFFLMSIKMTFIFVAFLTNVTSESVLEVECIVEFSFGQPRNYRW